MRCTSKQTFSASVFVQIKIMKASLIVGVLFGVLQVLAAQEGRRSSAVQQNCISELNLDRNEIEQILSDISNYFPENNANFNEFLSCYWKKTGYQSETGAINYGNLIRLLENFPRERFGGSPGSGSLGLELATEGIEGCKSTPQGSSHGETAVKVQNCVTKYIEGYLKNEN